MSAREMTAAEEWYRGLQEDYRAAAEDAMRHSHEPSPSFRLGDMGYVYDSGAYTTRDDDRPCTDCRAIGYESSPYGPDGDWGPEA